MSTLDIPQLAILLKSPKVKDRNDALVQLEIITSSRWRLPSKQLRILASAIFQLIDNESQQFIHSKSTTQASVASRLNKASYFLRLLIERSITDKLSIKYKYYLEICFTIKGLFYIQDQLLSPCCIDFSMTIAAILGINYVNEHLNNKDWSAIYAFLVTAVDRTLEDMTMAMQFSSTNEKVLIEVFTALQSLLQCDKSTNCLQLFENENYFRLLPLLNKTIASFKKEHPIHITIFKILNKLIIVLATTDFKFVHNLIVLGLELMVTCQKTRWEKLQEQFLIFLNLQTTHDFMYLEKFPKLIGDTEIEFAFLSEESIETQSNNGSGPNLLYSMELLIIELLNYLLVLSSEDICRGIGLMDSCENADWFKLRTIYLKGTDSRCWLYTTAATRLVKTYFDVKKNLMLSQETNRVGRSHISDIIFNNLVSSYSMIDFCNSMVSYRAPPGFHLLGLTLMVFYLEFEIQSKPGKEAVQSQDSVGTSKKANTSFDFTLSGMSDTIDLPELLQSALKTVDYEYGYFWLMMLARSVLNTTNLQELNSRKKYEQLRQILKLALYGINKPYSHVACDLISGLVLRHHYKANKIADDAIITQLESIIDFPGVNGPSIHNESFGFWYTVNTLCIDLNIKKKSVLARKIDEWLCEKWDTAFTSEVLIEQSFDEFVCWLYGLVPKVGNKLEHRNSYEGSFTKLMHLQMSQQKLESFIALKKKADKVEESLNGISPIMSVQNFNFWSKVSSMFSKLNTEPISYDKHFSWLILLSKLLSKMSCISSSRDLWDTLYYQVTIGLEAYSTFNVSIEDTFNIIRMIVDYSLEDADGTITFLSRVPFDKFLRCLVSSFQIRNNRVKRPHSDEDIEFSEVRESSTTPESASIVTYGYHEYKSLPIIDLVKFKVLQLRVSGKDDMEILSQLISFIEQFGNDSFLPALLYIVDEQLPMIHCTDQKPPLIRLLRALGGRALSDQEFDRNEIVLVTVSRTVTHLLPLLVPSSDDPLYRDCFDIVQWLYALGSKNYITTEISSLDYIKFLVTFLQSNNEMFISQASLVKETYLKFSQSTNTMKSKMVDDFSKLIENSNTSEQMEIYSKLFEYFVTPQSSVERGATYVFFFSLLSVSSSTILRLALFNLTECSKFTFFVPYLKLAFNELCIRYDLPSSQKLFATVKLDLLRGWWIFDSIKTFPFSLFSYDSLSEFLSDNYREITAVVVSTKSNSDTDFRTGDRSVELLSLIANVRNIAPETLVVESLSLIIPLSYTKNGIKNRSFEILMGYIGSFKQEMKIQLPVIIFEIIKMLDVSNEAEIARLLPRIAQVSQLIDQESSTVSNSSEMVVPMLPGLELINKVVDKYYTEKSFFWSTAMIYFLIRRVGMSLSDAHYQSTLVFGLRRIKLVLIMGGENSLSLDIINLIVKTSTSLLEDKTVALEVYRMLAIFENFYQVEVDYFESLNTMLLLLNSLMANPVHVNNELYDSLVDKLNIYADKLLELSRDAPGRKVIIAAIRKLRGEQSLLQTSDIEEFLSEKISYTAITVASKMFSSVVDPEVLSTNVEMLKNILALSNEQSSRLTEQFKLWLSKCLSKYYYDTKTSNLLDLLETREYDGSDQQELRSELSFLDCPMRELVKYSTEGNYYEAACAETVLGVFFDMEKANPVTLSPFVNVEPIYILMSGFVQRLKLQACVLLNDEPNNIVADTSLGNLIDSFDSFFDLNQNNWCPKVCLAVLKEVATFSIIGSVMSIFVVKVPSFALKTIASFICFYLNVATTSGEDIIVAMLNSFANLKHPKKDSIRVFVGILLSVRIASKTSNNPSFSRVFEKVDILKYYELASECKMYKSALMLFEDAFSDPRSSVLLESQHSTLQTVYEGLDDTDLIYGLPEKTSLDHCLTSRLEMGASDVQFQYSSGYLDASLKLNAPPLNDFTTMMPNSGMLGISSIISKTMNQFVTENETYEWSWKLSKWDQPVPKYEQNEHQSIYKVLKQVHDFPQNGENACRESLLRLMDARTTGEHKAVKDIRESFMGWLRSLASVTAIEDTINSTSFSTLDEELPDFEKFENIILAKQTSLQILAEQPVSHTPSDSLWSLSLKELVLYNNLARVNNEQQKMVSSTVLIDSICKQLQNSQSALNQNLSHLSSFQLAQSMWKQGVTNIPVLILKELYNAGGVDIYDQELKVDKFMIKAMMIEWMSESRQELASNLMENHVLPTAEKALRLDDQVQQSRIFRLLAQFCDTQYKSRTLSEQIQVLEKRVRDKETEIEELKIHYSSSQLSSDEKRSINKFYSRLKVQYKAECTDLEYARVSRKQFVVKAVEYYLLAMTVSDFPEEDLDKFCAIWLEQSNDDDLNDRIGRKLLSLPTHKLLSWCAQLISRLTKEVSKFQSILKQLILQMCVDHPYHTLYLLFSLKKHKSLAQKDANPLLVSKAIAAEALWGELMNQGSDFVYGTLSAIQAFSEECIRLAEFKASRGKTLNLEKLSDFSSFWLHNLPRVPPPTKSLKVDKTKSYSDVPVMVKMEKRIATASTGLSLPKIATFLLSDGSTHVMLMKHGTDDLRQDSIMEQVFAKVQNVFTRDKECIKRGLAIRTYNAVPLGPRSGVIEFVPNSTSLLDAISPYHAKYDKMKIEKARDIMRQCQNQDKIERLHEYQRIEAKIKPVLHLFFQGCFLSPDQWFESRVKYTHGVATSSIVGHILGLGDRHCNNILLDRQNGEPIHIDLGVAFDQGKHLAIPETVPFRLTRDVVDGFGVTGVEGAFRKSCQHTMRVLRESRDHIISILDVLRWDPLYSWTLSPIRKKRLQEDEARSGIQPEQDGSEAGRAVLAVSDKLVANGLSTEAVVRELIQEATSPQNLSLLYFGWCPFY
ncbi:TEL1 [Candida margitis]|uniref:TEL1 n=1 Tax=Candida margitis TaxID=1775924 RepID=UPI0022272C69|nr:TEL1 [Candida margitis]KAI5970016.1 TEL1 [Candida margitis]